MSNKKTAAILISMILGIIFFVFGLVLTLLGFIFGAVFDEVDYEKMTQMTTGSITDVLLEKQDGETARYAEVTYVVDGKTYTVYTGYSSSTFKKGREVNVMYDPSNPQYASMEPEKALMTVFSIMRYAGLGLFGMFVIMMIILIINVKKRKEDSGNADFTISE